MKLWKRLLLIHLTATCLYVGAYLLLQQRWPGRYLGHGPMLLEAEYLSCCDEANWLATAAFYPLEMLDRVIFPSRWTVSEAVGDQMVLERHQRWAVRPKPP